MKITADRFGGHQLDILGTQYLHHELSTSFTEVGRTPPITTDVVTHPTSD